jgi:hypothetical protein
MVKTSFGRGLIEVQKRWFAIRTLRLMRAGNFPAYRHPIADMIFGLGGRDLLGLCIAVGNY